MTYTDSDIQAFFRNNSSLKVADVVKYIQSAEEMYLYPILSESFVGLIKNDTVTDAKVISLFKDAVLNFAAYLFSQDASIEIGKNGIYENFSPDQGRGKATDSKLEMYQTNKLQIGHSKIELLLTYLENNATSFSSWTSTDAYTVLKNGVFATVKEFQEVGLVNIRNSRRIFIMIQPHLRLKLQQIIIELLTEDVWNDVKSATSGNKAKLVKNYVKPALAHLSFASSVFDLANILDYDTILSFDNVSANKVTGFKVSSENMISALAQQKQSVGESYLKKMIDFVLANPADFPAYPHPTTTPTGVFENDETWNVWGTGAIF